MTRISVPDSTSENVPSPRPRRSELPWHYSPWFIGAHATLALVLAIAVVLIERQAKQPSSWPLSAIMFILGGVIGLTGVGAMVGLLDTWWPFTKFRLQFTGGRFLTLKCPMFSPAYWRAVRQFRAARTEEGLGSGPTMGRQLLALLPLPLAVSMGLAARVWLNVPATSPVLVFLGCILTWGDLSVLLWWRSLPE